MHYRDLTSTEKIKKAANLMATSEAQELIKKPLVLILEENEVSKKDFIERLDKERLSINKYFKGSKYNDDKQNFNIRQLTLRSKLMLDTAKKAVANNDYSLTLNGLEKYTEHNVPTISRAIDELRPDSSKKYDIISEFSSLTDKNPNVMQHAKYAYEASNEIESMPPSERRQDLSQLGQWTKQVMHQGLLHKGHIRSLYERDTLSFDSDSSSRDL